MAAGDSSGGIRGIRAGRAFILIEAVDATGKILTAIGRKLKSWGRSLQMTGMDMAFKSVLAATPAAMAVDQFIKFDDAMRRVEARSEGTADQLGNLRQKALELSRASALSATNIADLMGELAQMGFTREQIDAMTEPINLLAQAGGTGNKALDAVNAAKLIAGTIRSMPKQLDFEDAGKLADVYAQALNLSNAALEDMATSMAYAAPIADQYGLKLEEVVTVLALLRNLNIDAETAGTGFRNLLLEMSESKGVGKFNEMLQELTGNVINFRDNAGNLISPIDALFAMTDVMDELGTAERGELLNILFGKRVVIPATAFMASRKQFEGMLTQMQKVDGVAQRMMGTMEGGLGGVWRKFVNSIQELAIGLGEALAPALTDVGKKFKTWIGLATDWIARNKDFVNGLMASIVLWGGLGIALLVTGYALSLVGSVLVFIGGLLSLLILSITGTIAAATALAAALTNVWVVTGLLAAGILIMVNRKSLSIMFREASASAQEFVGRLNEIKSTLQSSFSAAATALSFGDINAAFEVATTGMNISWMMLMDSLRDQWTSFTTFFQEAWLGAAAIVEISWTILAGNMLNVWDAMGRGIQGIILNIQEFMIRHMGRQTIGGGEAFGKFMRGELAGPSDFIAPLSPEKQAEIDLIEQQRKGIAEDKPEGTRFFEKNLRRIQRETAEAMERLHRGNREADEARLKAIEEEKKKLEDMIEAIKTRAQEAQDKIFEDALAGMDLSGVLGRDTSNIIDKGTGIAATSTPDLLEGLQKGSVEAAKAAYENMNRVGGEVAKKTLAATEASARSLQSIDRRLAEMEALESAMVGV